MQTTSQEHRWPDEVTGPWVLRVTFAVTDTALIPVGAEVWAVGPPAGWRVDLPDGEPVPLRASALRLPFARLADTLATTTAAHLPALARRGSRNLATASTVAGTRHHGGRPPTYDADHWDSVAAVYRAADRHPTTTVARTFDVAHTTAAKWVHRVRRMGLLPPHR